MCALSPLDPKATSARPHINIYHIIYFELIIF